MKPNLDELEDWLSKHNSVVYPYLENKFIQDYTNNPFYTEIIHDKTHIIAVEQNNMASIAQAVLQSAQSLSYNYHEHMEFVRRFSESLRAHKQILSQAIHTTGQGAFNFDYLANAIDNLTSENSYEVGSSILPIYAHERDAVKCIVQVLDMLKHPFHDYSPHGIIIFCGSFHLMLPLFILTSIIADCTPEKNLFSFIPVDGLEGPGEPYVGRLLSLVFQSCDLDCATREWIDAVERYSHSYWRCPTILVEESIGEKFLAKCSSILSLPRQSSFEDFPEIKPDYPHVNLLENKYGAILMHGVDDSGKSVLLLVHDLPPSSISNLFHKHPGPLGYVIKFRTPKEALNLTLSLINQYQSQSDIFFADLAVNIWTNNAGLHWYLASSLGKAGVQNFFINTPYEQTLEKLYTRGPSLLDENCLPAIIKGTNSAEVYDLKLDKSLELCSVAQLKWSSQGHILLKNKLSAALGGSCAKLDTAWAQFVSSTDAAIGGPCIYSVSYSEKCSSVFCYRWIVATGPLIIYSSNTAVYSEEYLSFLTVLVLRSIMAGNGIFFCYHEFGDVPDSFGNFIEFIHLLQSSLPTDLVHVILVPTSCNPKCIQFSSNVMKRYCVLDSWNLWKLQSESHLVLPTFSRVVRMFFTVGSEVFAS